MLGIDPFFAAVNDHQHLNNRSVRNLLVDVIRECSSEPLTTSAILTELRDIERRNTGPHAKTADKVLRELDGVNFTKYRSYLDELADQEISYYHIFSAEYPDLLWQLEDNPLGLYVDGTATLQGDNISIVGTRSAADSRISDTKYLAQDLGENGYTIVSGLARGIDAAAHTGAIKADAPTLAILPGDVETIQPKSNTELAAEIRRNGALVSEISKFAPMHNGRYIERNRITSGISDAVVIMASGETGGTVRQAELAEKQGKPRFLYDPADGTGQSPDILQDKGFVTFETKSELLELLAKREELFDIEKTKPSTLSEFCPR
jgi:DNA processing protein